MTASASDLAGRRFLDQARSCLLEEYLPKIRRCCTVLTPEQLWWRPNEASNAIGNLLLHLAGNLRQWGIAGLTGAADARRREEEFAARSGRAAEELLATLTAAVEEAAAVLAAFDPARLGNTIDVQGRRVSAQAAIFHAVEHFAGHTYQIVYITKLLTATDLGFYELENGIPRPTWGREPASG